MKICAMCFGIGVALLSTISQVNATTVSFGSHVANPDFTFSFQNGIADANLIWSTQPQPGGNLFIGIGPGFLSGYAAQQGFSNSSYVAYFQGQNPAFGPAFTPEIVKTQT